VSGPGSEPVVVIGVGNEFRRDDGAGPAVIGRLRDLVPSGVGLVVTDGEPTRLIEAWSEAALAVVVDAVRAEPSHPGQVHLLGLDDGPQRSPYARWLACMISARDGRSTSGRRSITRTEAP